MYNFCYPNPYTIEDICETFSNVAGMAAPKTMIPLDLTLIAAWPFEILLKLGINTGIHRDRVLKLAQSNHIQPNELISSEFQWNTDLNTALSDWLQREPPGDFT